MKNKLIFIFILLFTLMTNVNAAGFCEMSSEYKAYLELSEDEKKEVEIPPFCAERYSTNKDNVKVNYSQNKDKASASQSIYNAYNEGIVTSIKNQYYTGSCWAFSATSLVETLALKNNLGKYDFSEKHVEYSVTRSFANGGINTKGYNRELDDGGNGYVASSYYYRGDGPILESSMPFTSYNNPININSMPSDKALFLLDDFELEAFSDSTCNDTKINKIKELVIKYGSVSISIYANDSYLKNGFYYYNGSSSTLTNHAVTIIGWDDTISKTNFKTTATRDGAFIIKNSWGTSWGDNGFAYLSYSDLKACSRYFYYSGIVNNNYDYNYYSSEVLSNSGYGYDGNTVYYASKFSKAGNKAEILDRVSLDILNNYSYNVYISTDSNLSNQNTWKLLGSFDSKFDGIKTLTFDPVSIQGDFYIIVKGVSSSGNAYDSIMCKTKSSSDDYYYFNIDTGRNFISYNATSWSDISTLSNTYFNGCENVIYAYTREANVASAEFSLGQLTSNVSKVYTKTSNYFNVPVTSSNIENYSLFTATIVNSKGEDVTGLFNITGSAQSGYKISLTDNTIMGTYTFKLNYLGDVKSANFTVYALLESTAYTVSDNKIYANLNAEKELTKDVFLSKVKSSETLVILDKNGNDVTSTVTHIGTGVRIKISDTVYYDVVLNGDLNGDGKIQSNDALIINRYSVSLIELNSLQKEAADVSKDGKILSNDALLISRFLVGLRASL